DGLGLNHILESFDEGGEARIQQFNDVCRHGIVALKPRLTLAVGSCQLVPGHFLACHFRPEFLVDPANQSSNVRHRGSPPVIGWVAPAATAAAKDGCNCAGDFSKQDCHRVASSRLLRSNHATPCGHSVLLAECKTPCRAAVVVALLS